MAAITVRRNVFLLPIKPLFSLQVRFVIYASFIEHIHLDISLNTLSAVLIYFLLQGLFHKFVELDDSKPRLLSEDDYLIFKPGVPRISLKLHLVEFGISILYLGF